MFVCYMALKIHIFIERNVKQKQIIVAVNYT